MGEKRRIEVSITMDELEHRHSHDPGPGLSEIMEAVMRCARGEVQTTSWAGRRVSLAQVQQAFDELERQGLIRLTGKWCDDGFPVYDLVKPN